MSFPIVRVIVANFVTFSVVFGTQLILSAIHTEIFYLICFPRGTMMVFSFQPFMVNSFFPHMNKEELGEHDIKSTIIKKKSECIISIISLMHGWTMNHRKDRYINRDQLSTLNASRLGKGLVKCIYRSCSSPTHLMSTTL